MSRGWLQVWILDVSIAKRFRKTAPRQLLMYKWTRYYPPPASASGPRHTVTRPGYPHPQPREAPHMVIKCELHVDECVVWLFADVLRGGSARSRPRRITSPSAVVGVKIVPVPIVRHSASTPSPHLARIMAKKSVCAAISQGSAPGCC